MRTRPKLPPVVRMVLQRLAYGIPVLLIVTFGAAALSNFMPGSPAQTILGDQATPTAIAALNRRYGFDEPLITRYWHWLMHAIHGDLGLTVLSSQSVSSLLLSRIAVTGELTLIALIIALGVSVPLALVSAPRRGGVIDRASNFVASAILSVPSFVAVVILALVLTSWWPLFPPTGWEGLNQGLFHNLHYALLPAISLCAYEGAFFYRVLRNELISTVREDYVLVARAKGLPRRYIMLRHALRPSLGALVTVFGLSLGRLLGGSVIAETFFAVPGIGAEAVNAVSQKDLGVLQAIVAFAVVLYIVIFIVIDLAYAWIDPRVEVS